MIDVRSNGRPEPKKAYDVVVVGAGFAGMYMLTGCVRSAFLCPSTSRAAAAPGTGTVIPARALDIESTQYSYSSSDELQQEWNWSERYVPRPEILRYANHVAARFGVRRDNQFKTRVERSVSDEAANLWSVRIFTAGPRPRNSLCSAPLIPGKPRIFMLYIGGVGVYGQIRERGRLQGYSRSRRRSRRGQRRPARHWQWAHVHVQSPRRRASIC